MIITPHLLLGAAIGAKVKHLGWIIILGIIGHFLLDKIPHWDYGEKIEKLTRNKKYNKVIFSLILKMAIDGFIGLTIVAIIVWQKNILNLEYLTFILIGIFASLLPDFALGAVKLFSYFNKFQKFSKKYLDFHDRILHSPIHIFKPTPLGVGTEILISLIAILILTFA